MAILDERSTSRPAPVASRQPGTTDVGCFLEYVMNDTLYKTAHTPALFPALCAGFALLLGACATPGDAGTPADLASLAQSAAAVETDAETTQQPAAAPADIVYGHFPEDTLTRVIL